MGVGCLIERWYVWVGYNLGSVGDEVIVGDRRFGVIGWRFGMRTGWLRVFSIAWWDQGSQVGVGLANVWFSLITGGLFSCLDWVDVWTTGMWYMGVVLGKFDWF